MCSKSFRKSTYHNKINDWTILHSFRVSNSKKQVNVKNHITKLAWSGDDKFSLALLDQNFKPINKDLISSCYINMCISPVTVENFNQVYNLCIELKNQMQFQLTFTE